MNKSRLEAFSDGVLAIIITIMVLELKAPHGDSLTALLPLAPKFLTYILSFIYVAIYWNNHHHLFQAVRRVSGGIMWANAHLLFWLSLIPFVTAWAGENHFAPIPVALYGIALFMAAIAYYILTKVLLSEHGAGSELSRALRTGLKEKVSSLLYATAIGLAFWNPYISLFMYVVVAAIWIVPDRRIERILKSKSHPL